MKILTISIWLFIPAAFAQSSVAFQHPRDQIALQLGAIQMGYYIPFQIVGNPTMAQRAANALVMGRNALDATVAKPAVKVVGVVDSPAVDTVEYRDQLYRAVDAVVTSPVFGSIKGSVTLVGGKRQTVSATLALPPNSYTVPVPYALEAATSVDAQNLNSDFETLSSNFTALQNQTKSLSSNVTTLQVQNTGIMSNVTATQNQTTTLSSNFSNLKNGLDGLSAYFTSLQQSLGTGDFSVLINYISSLGIIPIYTGNATVSTLAGNGNAGFADGMGRNATFNQPEGVAVDGGGNVYVADTENNLIRKITPNGNVTTLAGNVEGGYVDGFGANGRFSHPSGIAVDSNGNIYVADSWNNRIRKISAAGNVSSLAGSGGQWDLVDGLGDAAVFSLPSGVAVDSAGNVFVADRGHNAIRKITPNGMVSTVAGRKSYSFADGIGSNAMFHEPNGVAVDLGGNVYVADEENYRIRKISTVGVVTTLSGGSVHGAVDGSSAVARFASPKGVAVDSSGNVYVADQYSHTIRKISLDGSVATLAGKRSGGFLDGLGKDAEFARPCGVAVGQDGSIYVADTDNNRIRKITVSK